jgi:hypothetical protein
VHLFKKLAPNCGALAKIQKRKAVVKKKIKKP